MAVEMTNGLGVCQQSGLPTYVVVWRARLHGPTWMGLLVE